MKINILYDDSFDIDIVSKSLKESGIEYSLFDTFAELKNNLPIQSSNPVLLPATKLKEAKQLSDESYIVIIEDILNPENVLAALRSGAVDYYSLDGKTGRIQTMLSDLEAVCCRDNILEKVSGHGNKRSELRFRAIAEHTYHSEFWIAPGGQLIYQSPSIERMTGFATEKFKDDTPAFFYSIIHPHDFDKFKMEIEQLAEDRSNPPLFQKFRIITKTGEIRWWESTTEHIFDTDGTYIGQRGTSRDITRQVHAEQETEKILREKELLIKEVHHRVKNNLAVISGIINLQEIYIHDNRDIYILHILKKRIESMISVHELLYSGKSSETFSLEDLARKISMNLVQNKIYGERKIDVRFNINPVPLDSNFASPIGLILNELVMNCLKYAFNDREEGRIFIGSTIFEKIRTLYVEDDGPGFHEDVLNGERHNLGLELVKSLAQQIGGELYLHNSSGSQAVIVFPSTFGDRA
ncbi:MAG: histidine kinase dimerization/phosphoacceptor domain -containing protein [Spirochaetales bacterium]|uniref:histidine kinase n=1 Tax=Candidatus Thalassospirochaeta sargassi TaxID=3119039 RepID=A0AAJ1IEH9_9SPIO|nr:histidine kinase dimerization/phosphoacceptor domain -containing protein [Spirochaetales bacterium]